MQLQTLFKVNIIENPEIHFLLEAKMWARINLDSRETYFYENANLFYNIIWA